MTLLSGRTFLLTGAARGLGAVIAERLVADGASLVLHYHHSAREAESLAERLGPERCYLVQADLGAPGAASELWRAAWQWTGKLDGLINNAACMMPAGVDDPLTQWQTVWRQTLQVNLIAAADLCYEAIRDFRSQGGGLIVNIASRAAFRGDAPPFMHYAASKGGLVALTRSIARGFAQDNILAYAIAPGFVATEKTRATLAMLDQEAILKEIPLGSIVPPEEVAELVSLLVSGRLRHATGATFDLNGASYVR